MTKNLMTSSLEENLGYGQLFAVLVRRKNWILAIFLGALGVAVLLSLFLKPTYRSSMQLLVDQNYRGKSEQKSTQPQFADSEVQADYATQLTLMNSSILLQRIVDRLHSIYPKLTLKDVKKSLAVSPVTWKNTEKSTDKKGDTKIFQATYEDPDPVRSQQILQTVQQVYQDYNREQQKLRLAKGLKFINEQVPQIQNRLQQAESALENFRKTYNFLDPELQSSSLVESLDNISQEQRNNLVLVQDLSSRYAVLQQKIAISPQAILMATRLSQSSRYQNLLNEIQKTELAILKERLRFTDKSLIVKNLLEQQNQQRLQLLVEKQRVFSNGSVNGSSSSSDAMKAGQLGANELALVNQFNDVQVNLRAARDRFDTLMRIEQKYKQEIERFPALLSEYNRLQPAVQVNRETLQQLLKSRQDLGLEIARGGFDWQVVEEPKLGEKTSPKLLRNLLLGAVVGLFLGGVAAFLRDAMDDSIHSLDEMKKQTSLPLLGTVPKMLLPGSNQTGISQPVRYVSTLNPASFQSNLGFFRESIDLVYKNIQLLESSTVLRSLLVTSAVSGEGKSTLAIGLAMSAARLHQRVLLIDADLRRPSLHEKLNLSNGEGLSTLLSNDPKISTNRVIQSLSLNSTLDVLTSGPIPLDPAKLLSSSQMAKLMVEFEENYDLVLLDAPPILGIVDTLIMASFCSGVVLVQQIDQVNRKDLIAAAEIMNRFNVIGMIPNGVQHSTNQYTYDDQEADRKNDF